MKYALVALLALLQDPKIELKWKFSKDQQLRWEMAQRISVESDMMNLDLPITYILKQTVKEVSDKGEATLDTAIEGIKFNITGNMGDTEYDSTKDKKAPDDPLGGALASMVGQSFSMKLDGSGTVTNVTGFDKIVQKALDGMDEGQEAMKGIIQQLYNDGVQKAMLQMAFVQLPKEPIAEGGAWKNEFEITMPVAGSLTFALDGKLKAVRKGGDGGEAEIEQSVKVTAAAGGGGMLELRDSKGTRKSVFNTGRGQLTESTLEVELQLKMGDGDLPLKIGMKMKPLAAGVASKDDKK